MKIIKTYDPPENLKEYSLSPYEDKDYILKRFGEKQGSEILKELKSRETVLICKEWYDPQSLSRGTEFIINNKVII